jgi:hypothetical protein
VGGADTHVAKYQSLGPCAEWTLAGTDFRDMSVIEVEFAAGSTDPAMSVERIVIDSSVPEDPATLEVSGVIPTPPPAAHTVP